MVHCKLETNKTWLAFFNHCITKCSSCFFSVFSCKTAALLPMCPKFNLRSISLDCLPLPSYGVSYQSSSSSIQREKRKPEKVTLIFPLVQASFEGLKLLFATNLVVAMLNEAVFSLVSARLAISNFPSFFRDPMF